MDALDEAIALHNAGALTLAAERYRHILARDPVNFDALHLLGVVALQGGNFGEAENLIARAISVLPDNAAAHLNHALALSGLGRPAAALAAVDAALVREAGNAAAWNTRGQLLWRLGRMREAVNSYDRALALKPDATAHNNRGVALAALGEDAAALGAYDAALTLDPGYAGAHNNRAAALRKLRRNEDALAACETALRIDPDLAAAWNNRGLALAELHQTENALSSYARALELQPELAEAHNNRGLALAVLGRLPEALASYDRAVALRPDDADAHNNRAAALLGVKDYAGAAQAFDRVAALEPGRPFLAGARLHAQSMMCDWRGRAAALADIEGALAGGRSASATFPLLATSDSPALHRRAAEVWSRTTCPPNEALGPIPPRRSRDKIRVGYFSMDFRQHAVASLTAGLFESHDRSRFETIGFSFGPDSGDAMRRRLEGAFDRFLDLRTASDRDIAAQARALEIDIAVDLAGYTHGARPGIFALRAAPIQASYIGYPGTMGAPYIDYIIADNILVPPEARAHYAEKVVALPCFQANDARRAPPTHTLARAKLGLPAAGFVFCCLNAPYKIAPETFASWMRILKAVAHSVILLSGGGEITMANLRREAVAHGVAPERIVFAERVPEADYLARFRAADLFLDTLPYNAHTTASDALWAGLPVLTRVGASYAGRVGASLLTAVGLPELITQSGAAYESLAIDLARAPERISAIRARLERERGTALLFDTARFTRHLERAYIEMHARHSHGRAPDHITIAPGAP